MRERAAVAGDEQKGMLPSAGDPPPDVDDVVLSELRKGVDRERAPAGLHEGLASPRVVARVGPADDLDLVLAEVDVRDAHGQQLAPANAELEKPEHDELVPDLR